MPLRQRRSSPPHACGAKPVFDRVSAGALPFTLPKRERFPVHKEMHQLVGAHDRHLFFLQDPPDLIAVREDDLQRFAVLNELVADVPVRVSVYGRAGFVGKAHRREAGLLEHGVRVERRKGQAGLFVHLAHGRFAVILAPFDESRRKLVDVLAERVAVLADQDDLVPRRPV